MTDYLFIPVIIILVEMILMYNWVMPYYRHGITVFNKTITIKNRLKEEITAGLLENILSYEYWVKQLEKNTFGYRNRFKFRRSILSRGTSIMYHGIIVVSEDKVQVKGYINIATVLVMLFLPIIFFIASEFYISKTIFFLFIYSIIMWIVFAYFKYNQKDVYNYIEDFLQKE